MGNTKPGSGGDSESVITSAGSCDRVLDTVSSLAWVGYGDRSSRARLGDGGPAVRLVEMVEELAL